MQGKLARAVLALFRHGAVTQHRADIHDNGPLPSRSSGSASRMNSAGAKKLTSMIRRSRDSSA